MSPFSTKFGANERECITLLRLARQLSMNLVGCSFHVGSRCLDPNNYSGALKQARRIFDIAQQDEFGFDFKILDIGGGFSGHNWDKPSFPEVAKTINHTLEKLFPESEGKYMSASKLRLRPMSDSHVVVELREGHGI